MDYDIIIFKSFPIYWNKEQKGLKKNTLREIEKGDGRFITLKRFKNILDKEELMIKIVNTETKQNFERKISDIHFTNKNQVLISWEG